MKKGKALSSKREEAALKRLDSWVNVLTGLGMANRDKLTGATVQKSFLNQTTLDALYQSDDVAARIVDRDADDMCREGFEIKILDGDPALADAAMVEFDKLCGLDKFNKALKWANLYGTGMLYVGMLKGDPNKPIEQDIGKPIEYVAVIDRYMLTTSGNVTEDLKSKNFGYPETYQLITGKLGSAATAGATFHWSRACRFDGKELSSSLLQSNSYFGDSVLSSIYNCIRNYNQVMESSALIVQDFSQTVFKLKNLSDMIASGDVSKVLKRFELVNRTASICNMLVIEDGEEFEKKTPALGGIDVLIKAVGNRLVSATSMPHTILLGESPSGLGATGNSEKVDWYDYIRNQQEKKMRPALTKIFDLIFSTKGGISKGKIPKYQISFNALWQMDDKELAEIRELMSRADGNYIDRGVVTPDEVANSRFGGDYSLDTDLDNENRETLEGAPAKLNEEE
jgi:phage-related protein (TIGR01555 family)